MATKRANEFFDWLAWYDDSETKSSATNRYATPPRCTRRRFREARELIAESQAAALRHGLVVGWDPGWLGTTRCPREPGADAGGAERPRARGSYEIRRPSPGVGGSRGSTRPSRRSRARLPPATRT
jgi:hypothetical protein